MPQAGYVYILHGIGTNYIKVGKSTNLVQRLQSIAASVPFPIQLLSAQLVFDVDAEEQQLLQHYQPYRTRGEWFELPEALLMQWPLGSVQPVQLRRPTSIPGDERQSTRTKAIEWLQDYLQQGQQPTASLMAAAAAVALPERTLNRAKKALGITAHKVQNAWYWRLPEIDVEA